MNMRLHSCREALQAINVMLRQRRFTDRIVEKMRYLEELMARLDAQAISESDMEKVEASANQLFGELKRMFRNQNLEDARQQEKMH